MTAAAIATTATVEAATITPPFFSCSMWRETYVSARAVCVLEPPEATLERPGCGRAVRRGGCPMDLRELRWLNVGLPGHTQRLHDGAERVAIS
jgi:hypothetical protein